MRELTQLEMDVVGGGLESYGTCLYDNSEWIGDYGGLTTNTMKIIDIPPPPQSTGSVTITVKPSPVCEYKDTLAALTGLAAGVVTQVACTGVSALFGVPEAAPACATPANFVGVGVGVGVAITLTDACR